MAQNSISIPVKGDKNTVKAVKAIAASHDQTMAEFVLSALVAYCGDELKSKEYFFAKTGRKNIQSSANTEVKESHHAA